MLREPTPEAQAPPPGCTDPAKVERLRTRLNADVVERIVDEMRVLTDATRVRIVWALTHEREICVSEFVELLHPLKQSSVSHALSALRSAGVVRKRPEGKVAYYSLKTDTIRDFLNERIDKATRA
ncbi:metalloregulator ArsR/SmtB family transcription factor [Longimicrobium sp.]|jgi:DNA-binding transcriptional ArsR family regulator|uniref:ArsR/SmtB family transcription factor n=1 Tax=Longimicrobium sp. TaxID=2029185 RepID=UPI002EDB6265